MERKIELNFKEVPAKIDYWALKVPTYESAFSVNPRWKNNESDQFICTAVFKDEYISKINSEGGKLSRSADNMLPAFFVYESDNIPIGQQLKICNDINQDILLRNWVFSQTYSGSKSIHTLVYIDPQFRQDVARDFRYYWRVVGERIFGKNISDMLDSQCASIGRLSRNPNGIRENGKKQVCIYYNEHYAESPINLQNWIIDHTKVLENLEREMAKEQLERQMKFDESKEDEEKKLERIYAKGNCSEAFKLAYSVLVNNDCPKGANYCSAASALRGCGFSRGMIEKMLSKASEAHPTNIPRRSVETILRRLNV